MGRHFRTLSLPLPAQAAGSGVTYVFSTVQRVKLHALKFTLNTSATVANRMAWVQLKDPNGMAVFGAGYSTAITAGTSTDFVVSPAYGAPAVMQGPANVTVGLAWPNMWLPPAWEFSCGAVALDAGDTFTNLTSAADYSEDVWDQEQELASLAMFIQSLA